MLMYANDVSAKEKEKLHLPEIKKNTTALQFKNSNWKSELAQASEAESTIIAFVFSFLKLSKLPLLFEYRSSVSELSFTACELYLTINGNPKRYLFVKRKEWT